LEQTGRADEAEQTLARALESANEAEVNLIGYTFLQQGRTGRAIEVFRKNVADHPDSWNTYDSLGEAYRAAGEIELAIENYGKALAMVEDPTQKGRIQMILEQLRRP
jgi:Flp pilus assembly protein TadD